MQLPLNITLLNDILSHFYSLAFYMLLSNDKSSQCSRKSICMIVKNSSISRYRLSCSVSSLLKCFSLNYIHILWK